MKHDYTPRWHKISFDRFINDRLPELLAKRLPLIGYQVESTGVYECRVTVTLASSAGQASMVYHLLQPDETGLFEIPDLFDHPRVVVATAPHAGLDTAEVKLVGDHLYDHVRARLGEAPGDLAWDESLMRAWLPLDAWIKHFFKTSDLAQPLETQNWLSRTEHRRRLRIIEPDIYFNPEQFGRVCPVLMPEGPSLPHIRYIAMGADIRDGRVVTVDDDPGKAFSVAAAMIPFFEHDDRNRKLMGANMMRQWIIPDDPEPALVQTGYEPDEPDFWSGRNLLTAFIAWDGDVLEDGIVLSESGAKRLSYPYEVEVGDKLSNRHGSKGCVSRILPDDRMPKMADGAPVELIHSSIGTVSRMVMGQFKEAVMSRIVKADGAPAIVPPLQAPAETELRERLKRHGLPEDGMETLVLDGKPLGRPSTVGWVYWGRTTHHAGDKIRVISQTVEDRDNDTVKFPRHFTWQTKGPAYKVPSSPHQGEEIAFPPWLRNPPPANPTGQRQSQFEGWVLRDLGAYETFLEQFHTRDELSEYTFFPKQNADTSATTMVERLMKGPVEQLPAPRVQFKDLQRRLALTGIHMTLKDETLAFRFGRPAGDRLKLARPLPHPWLHDYELKEVGLSENIPASRAVADANAKLSQMVSGKMPDSLTLQATEQLRDALDVYFDEILGSSRFLPLHVQNRMNFSGRGIIVPDANLHYDQLGISEEMAWVLFSPQVARALGDQEAVAKRTKEASKKLDRIMAETWVIITRAPAIELTSICAFRPVRIPCLSVRIHPFLCPFLNADFDGDQVAVSLPITEAGQQEARERLTVAAHVRRDPSLIHALAPTHDAMWGLADLSLTEKGRQEINKLAGIHIAAPDGYITRTTLGAAMAALLERDGVETALDAVEALARRGYDAARASGASISPFMGASLDRRRPDSDDPDAWDRYADELIEQAAARADFDDDDLGVPLLMVKSGARGDMQHLRRWLGADGHFVDEHGRHVPVRRSLSEGWSVEEMRANIFAAHRGYTKMAEDMAALGREIRQSRASKNFNALARAMRAPRPGLVFARAAAIRETDPLTDIDSRLFVGLRPK